MGVTRVPTLTYSSNQIGARNGTKTLWLWFFCFQLPSKLPITVLVCREKGVRVYARQMYSDVQQCYSADNQSLSVICNCFG